ncbi:MULTISPECIES: class I SAM-dependent methyltransferase [unclassified Candidatus Frackibacter]|uniref:class I SAM-dependent methyltransferase n=1 Tax=unclassified Candidatus Frackibacter TaxID=2648818 RepID=UPI000890FB32|nr:MULTISPECIES: class I SAM-dependent methyltransferase [unclassified Candidatus Frackibacter]SDC42064.1 Methyltransferase domain-containing protein [Candidatus Frackibacter sp. WG11]SEM59015.1 Methyltransferase domain-containing protein [Candidatus Frackibacter sp. WG12]SFL63091.1 Methyltransferase domain-containing protein [Candidatus Frackibacter sp. WG13]
MKENKSLEKELLNKQNQHWEDTFTKRTDMFGTAPSISAQKAAKIFEKEGKKKILELGGGQGRDTIFFAQNGFEVYVLDYCESGVETINEKARKMGLSGLINASCHDVRDPLPFKDESFDCCYSHMLYCMALTTQELKFLSDEVRRVLRPGGFNIYTARNTNDSDYGTGVHRGEDMYEVGGFIVHFFSKEKVKELAKGFEIVDIDEFEEGGLPRKLFQVTLKKKGNKS